MNLSGLSNENLIEGLKRLKAREDSLLVNVLDHILEIDRRQLFLPLGFPSLYSYLTQELKYSNGEAYRRIEAARLMRSVPESRAEVSAGRLNLTTMNEVRTAIKTKEKVSGHSVGSEERRSFVQAVLGCTKEQAQRNLGEKVPELAPLFEERRREHRDGSLEMTLLFARMQRARLERAREILASRGPMPKMVDAIDRLSEFFLNKKDLMQRHLASEVTPRQVSRITYSLRRLIFQRDKGECQFKNASGKICGSRYQIEIDHIVPVSAGGSNAPENLRCLCRAHNQWKSDRLI